MDIFWNFIINDNLMTVKVSSCLKDECDQNGQDQMRESEQNTGSILKLAANDKWATQKSKPRQQAEVKATKSGGKC